MRDGEGVCVCARNGEDVCVREKERERERERKRESACVCPRAEGMAQMDYTCTNALNPQRTHRHRVAEEGGVGARGGGDGAREAAFALHARAKVYISHM